MSMIDCLKYFEIGPGPITSPDIGFENAARHLCRLGVLRPVFVPSAGEFWYLKKEPSTDG